MFGTDDMTFCTADCKMKDECYRNPALIKEPQYPHSYADFSKNCMAYEPKEESDGEGCRLGEDGEWYKFVDNTDEYGYNCDPRNESEARYGVQV